MSVYGKMDSESGVAADTGTAVHQAASVWHKSKKKDASVAIKVMRELHALYPLANLDTADAIFQRYANDERNINATTILIEEKIVIRLPPTEDDKTQAEIVLSGTLDQVREGEGGILTLVDIKTGKSHEGLDMLNHYAMQQACYMYGASELLGRPVHRAALCRTNDYEYKSRPVFWHYSWGLPIAKMMIAELRQTIADVRNGRIDIRPSQSACKWCQYGGPQNCIPARTDLDLYRS